MNLSRFENDKSYHEKSQGQDRPRTKQRYSQKDSCCTYKVNKNKGSGSSKSTFTKYGTIQYGQCLAGTDGCFGCRNYVHKVRDCPHLNT